MRSIARTTMRGTAKSAEPKEHYYQDDDITSTHTMRTHDERPPNERPDEYMNERNNGNRKPLKETENGKIPNARSQQRERKDRTGKKIRFRMTRSKTNSE